MNALRQACLMYDYDMAIHRGAMNPDAIMQQELNDISPEQIQLLIKIHHLEDVYAESSPKPGHGDGRTN